MHGVMYAQVAILLYFGIGLVFGLVPPSGSEPIFARRTAVFAFGFAVTIIIVSRMLKQDNRLLSIPISVLGFNLIDTAYEIIATGNPEWFILPIVMETIFFLTYLLGFRALGQKGIARNFAVAGTSES